MAEQAIPHDTEAEIAVIGSLLIDGEAIYSIRNELATEHFFKQEHQLIYDSCMSLCSRGEAIDQITVSKELNNKNKLDEVGGVTYLSHLIISTPTSLHIEHYAKIVKNTAIQRMGISLGSQVTATAKKEADPIKLISTIGQAYLKLQSSIAVPQLVTPTEWAKYGIERYSKLNEGRSIAISTGIEQLDVATGGVFPGEYWILAGTAGIGKTSLAIQFADTLSIFGNVLLCSIEMSKGDVLDRRIATLTKQPLRKIRTGKYHDDLYGEITSSLGTISESNIYYFGQSDSIESGGGITTDSLYSMANYMKSSYGIKAIIVDYLQNLSDTYGKGLYEKTTHVSRRLQNMARSLDIPIICLCQLNRDLFHREDRRPRISDLRDSGGIEQDADVIIFLHRESAFSTEAELAEIGLSFDDAELLIAKQRQGDNPNIRIPLKWNVETKTYYEMGGYPPI